MQGVYLRANLLVAADVASGEVCVVRHGSVLSSGSDAMGE